MAPADFLSFRLAMKIKSKIRMGAIYKYIHENYDKSTDVNLVASTVHLSTPAFCRYFKKQTNMTFTDFVNQYRIIQAKTLLLKDITVTEACYEVGFESLGSFSTLFRRHTGLSPRNYRKSAIFEK